MTSRSAPRFSGGLVAAVSWVGPWLALASLALWSGTASVFALLLAAGATTASVLLGQGRRGRAWGLGTVLLVVAILMGLAAHRQVGRVLNDWDGYWSDRVADVEVDLNAELDRRQAAGEAASDGLIELWTRSGVAIDPDEVAAIRSRFQASALALYDGEGGLLVWDGSHRGLVPEDVQRGGRRHSYRDLPLFGYLYVTAVAGDGTVAVAAYLLRAALPEALRADVGDLAARFLAETGERIRITQEDPGIAEVVWDLALDDDRLLSVVLERPERVQRASAIMDAWRGRVGLAVALAWLLFAVGSTPTRGGALAGFAGLVALAAWLPLDSIGALAPLFDPDLFRLPGPVPLTLGRFAVLAATGFALLAMLPRWKPILNPTVAGLGAGVAFPVLWLWVRAGVAPTSLAGGRLEWIVYEVGLAALLSLAAGIALATTRVDRTARAALPASVLSAVVLAAGMGAWVALGARHPTWWLGLWAVPVALASRGLGAPPGWRRDWGSWVLAIVLGGSAAVPAAWSDRFDARLSEGRLRLEALRAPVQPRLEEALLTFGRLADSLDAAGASDVSILYDGWSGSGLAELGQPVWLQVHRRDGAPGEGLRVGVEGGEPEPLGALLVEGWTRGGVRLSRLGRDDARYILTTRLADDDLISAVAPPFSVSRGPSGLGPLLRGANSADVDPLTVLPLLPGDDSHGSEPTLLRSRGGWQVEIGLDFVGGPPYHAHYLVDLPGVPLGVARAGLLLVLNLAILVGFWLGGQALLRDPAEAGLRLPGSAISFRGRVTLALFGFFALANALFGTVAYRTLAEASRRSAQVIAERVVEDAAGWYLALAGEMERLATQVGAELLEYRDGELREGSVEELVELGLYEAWVPHGLQRRLESQEADHELTETSVGGWEYVTAYRRLPDGDVLAAQVPLQAGTTALQTTDLIELLGFVMLVGAALSLALAMTAGRALTRPIHALQVASEGVGAGDLGLRLPSNRTDEFGAVFRAFNRMVGRVRRARRQLVRTSRRTQLIMDEAAVGMVALDPGGRVTLVNPRAEELLGTEVFVGRQLPAQGELGRALAGWLTDYLEGSADEGNSDFQAGERRVRVRVRRLGRVGSRRGVVVALDDVTDELRAERVLAWGEMARQVAHEVKNPLTPIKLSIQHVRRAWEDGRPDFGEILVKNADAMLSEIDRLAGIAQSFSRFGAPGGDQAVPLEAVSIADVVSEVIALYGGSSGPVRFFQDVEVGLSRVVARPAELKEVLVNLLENSRMAGHEGTSVTMRARHDGEESVLLSVVDDGDGIPPEALPRIFEPQFSTRSTGTGLGLAIVQRVVRSWGGSVAVSSEPGLGTTVSVTLRVWPDTDGRGPDAVG